MRDELLDEICDRNRKWGYEGKPDFECDIIDKPDYQIILFQGSKSKLDYVIDFLSLPIFYNFRLVHLGFALGVRKSWNSYINKNIDFNKKTYITGHSLGGARASLLGLIYGKKFRDVEIITFAAPSVEWFPTRLFKSNIKQTRYINRKDLVPKLPGALFGYYHRGDVIKFGDESFWPIIDISVHPETVYRKQIK